MNCAVSPAKAAEPERRGGALLRADTPTFRTQIYRILALLSACAYISPQEENLCLTAKCA